MDLLIGALLLTVRIGGLGWAWSTVARSPDASGERQVFLECAGVAAVVGIVLNLLPALFLSALDVWTPLADWAVWSMAMALGLVLSGGRVGKQGAGKGFVRSGAGLIIVVGLAVAVAVALPQRSEWLAGGWDPGIYQNNAISIAQHNGIGPLSDTLYAELTVRERTVLSSEEGAYREVFPGVPIRLEDGALPRYFFHLTSVCGAWMYRLGGMDLLTRMPMVLAFLGLLPVAALLGSLGLQGSARWVGLVAWCIAPLWWYHQAIPTSEMLQLFLLCGGVLLYLQAVDQQRAMLYFAGLVLFAGTVNRFDYPVFAGVLLMVAAWAESRAGIPGRERRIAVCLAALAVGILWNLATAQVTIFRLQEKDHVLWVVLGPFLLTALAGLVLANRPFPSALNGRIDRILGFMGMAGASVLVLLIGVLSAEPIREIWFRLAHDVPLLGEMSLRFFRLLGVHGSWWFLAVAIGALLLACPRGVSGSETVNMSRNRVALFGLGLGVILLALLLHGGIAPIYPWALRRYFFYLMPFATVTIAFLAAIILAEWGKRYRLWPVAGCLVLCLAAVDGVRHSWEAARVSDFLGMSAVVEDLDRYLQPGDVLVADDPKWGTPLLLARGRNVLNGKLFWESRSTEYREEFLSVLSSIHDQEGRRVVWLTSTSMATDIYRVEFGDMAPLLEGMEFHYPTVIHSSRADRFAQRMNTVVFGLHVWDGDARVSAEDG
jgi:hypothetical protein